MAPMLRRGPAGAGLGRVPRRGHDALPARVGAVRNAMPPAELARMLAAADVPSAHEMSVAVTGWERVRSAQLLGRVVPAAIAVPLAAATGRVRWAVSADSRRLMSDWIATDGPVGLDPEAALELA